MKACKICAYKTQADAEAGTHNDTAISGCNWSTTTPTYAKQSFTITGANYEKALNGGTAVTDSSMDGAHFCVVYVQSEAGNWSKSAIFS